MLARLIFSRALLAVEGLMHLAPACSFWLLLGVAFYEWPKMAQANALSLVTAKPLLYLAAAAMGFAVNSLAYIVIQLASSLTLKVSLAAPLPLRLRNPYKLHVLDQWLRIHLLVGGMTWHGVQMTFSGGAASKLKAWR